MIIKNKNLTIHILTFIIIVLVAVIVTPYISGPGTSAGALTAISTTSIPAMLMAMPGSGMDMSTSSMVVKTYDIQPGEPVPTVDFTFTKDTLNDGSWDLHVLTTNFTFTPENLNLAPVLDQGHVHLYIDDQLTVVLGPWFHVGSLAPGPHTIRVALAANDHSIFSYQGNYIQAVKTLTVK